MTNLFVIFLVDDDEIILFNIMGKPFRTCNLFCIELFLLSEIYKFVVFICAFI